MVRVTTAKPKDGTDVVHSFPEAESFGIKDGMLSLFKTDKHIQAMAAFSSGQWISVNVVAEAKNAKA